jgi:integrase
LDERAHHAILCSGVAGAAIRATLALWTGQRQGDLIRRTWVQYDGSHIRLRQGKRKKRVAIPVGAPLNAALHARRPDKPEGAILRNTFGEPWTSDGFRTSWGKAFERAGQGDEDLHSMICDWRGTAVTRLALAGCTVPEIAALSWEAQRRSQRAGPANLNRALSGVSA